MMDKVQKHNSFNIVVFFFVVFVFLPCTLTSSVQTSSLCVSFNSRPSWCSWFYIIVSSKAKLERHVNKEYPCFRSSEL
jgi:hypothetical protein